MLRVIASLRGTLLEKTEDGAVLEVGGVGYAVVVSPAARERLPAPGAEVFLHAVESTAMYGGGVTLYGFPTADEKRVFLALKENVPGAGGKKALEFLDKASRSLADFRRAVFEKDAKELVSIFGFTPKTAEKILAGLKGKLDALALPAGSPRPGDGGGSAIEDAIQGLAALGYRHDDAREAARSALAALGSGAPSQALIRDALRRLSVL